MPGRDRIAGRLPRLAIAATAATAPTAATVPTAATATIAVIAVIAVIAAIAGMSPGTARAHHSYAAYDRCKTFTVAGEIERISWANPHVVFTLEADAGSYLIQWLDVERLKKEGVTVHDLKVGDEVVVSGSANRDPSVRILTLLTAVSRPSDGWKWSAPASPAASAHCEG